jgi:hypothetical protein
MKTILSPQSQNRSGYALIITMIFLGIMLTLFATMMYYTVSNGNLTNRNNQYNASEAAAESATEKVLSQMTHDFENECLSNSGTYYGTSFLPSTNQGSWPIQYTYSNPSNNTSGQINVWLGAWATNATVLNAQYTGLYGIVQNGTISATATPNSGPAVPSTVTETVQFALIPLFQFAIFYNMNLEIAAAQSLNIKGAVYSNGGLWSGSSTITFSTTVSAVGLATNAVNDPFCAGYTGSGKSTYSLATQPTSGNDTITMPVGSNNNPASVEAIVNIPPPAYCLGTASGFTTNGQLYLANEADLYLTNFPSGTNWGWGNTNCYGSPMALYYQDSENTPNYLTWVTNDYYVVSNQNGSTHYMTNMNWVPFPTNGQWNSPYYANTYLTTNGFWFTNGITGLTWTNNPPGTNYVLYMGYSFLTNVTFYDWREGWGSSGTGPAKTVRAVQLDLVAYNRWLTNSTVTNNGITYNSECTTHKGHPLDSLYVFNAVPLTTTTLPAVRVMNGGQMPPADSWHGFTLATAMPIYVWGDYNASNSSGSSLSQNNTVYTEPAALMGDALSILSDGWVDTNSLAKHTGGPAAKATTINAACLEGIVESNTNNNSSDAEGYSGGVENFLRMLEDWGSSTTLYYNGSIIVMFPSQYATNCWQQTGGFYTAPNRSWAFDTNFMIGNDLPPITPKSQGVIRGTWGAY